MAYKPQFSLRAMFIATTVVALLVGEAAAFPGWLALLAALAVTSLLPPAFVAGITYGRGYVRAFFVGTCSWWLATRWILGTSTFESTMREISYDLQQVYARGFLLAVHMPHLDKVGQSHRIGFFVLWLMMIAAGLVAMLARWLILGKTSNEPQ